MRRSSPETLKSAPEITWSPPAFDGGSPILGYSIFRGNASGGEFLLAEVGNITSYEDHAVTRGWTYYYRVTATNVMGEGPESDELEVILINQPPVCEIVYPSHGELVYRTAVIRVEANDYDGSIQTVEIRIENGSWIELEQPWEYEWDTTGHPDGYVTIYARAFDGVNYSEVVNATAYIQKNEWMVDPPTPLPYIYLAVTFGAIFVYVLWVILRRRKREDDEDNESLLEDQSG